MIAIDLNCDMGEGIGNDALIMPYLTSCNISCGAHAGSEDTIRQTILEAKKYGVKIGAHPSYPDKLNFGRLVVTMKSMELKETLISQLNFFKRIALQYGVSIHHIKPHGALYNQANVDPDIAKVILEVIHQYFPTAILYAPDHSIIASLAEKYNIKVWNEAFADRNYEDDLSLLPRNHPMALIHDREKVFTHISYMIQQQKVKSFSGKFQPIHVDTICIHGDHPSAVDLAKSIRSKLNQYQ